MNFLLNELWAKLSVWTDEQNYIYMKVPVGKHLLHCFNIVVFIKIFLTIT